jgi:pimeloyl-ACP methyl ester carboxylesterase
MMLPEMSRFHCTRASCARLVTASALVLATLPLAGQNPDNISSNFTVFQRGIPIGSEQVTVDRSDAGWTITSSSRMGAPLDLVGRLIQARYTPDWKPIELTVDATLSGQPLASHVAVTGSAAHFEATQGTQTAQQDATVAADALILVNPFWGPFEALAQRLRTAAPGTTLSLVATQNALVEVGDSTEETIQTPARLIHARSTHVKLPAQGQLQDADIWSDENGHLLRIVLPAQLVEVVREDIASVASRRVMASRAGDEQVRIAANGFALAATVSKPDTTGKPAPAVVLVGGSGPTDRDETVAGIPIFGQLANALADAGYLVVRYDKRGVGQSGGRTEAAALDDFAEDLRGVLKYTADRRDVDKKRIALLGHSEGGSVAMLVAAKDGRVAALALAATIGETGAELNMYQVRHLAEISNRAPADVQTTLALQKKIQDAVLTGKGWDGIAPALRKQADTPWFQSFLAFDPAKVMPSIDQPILIVQGSLDTQVPPDNADRLAALADARKRAKPADVVRIDGVNHLFAPAKTGEVDEYARLTDKHITPQLPQAIVAWLAKVLPAPK